MYFAEVEEVPVENVHVQETPTSSPKAEVS